MKMNEIVKTLLVCGVCVACVACGSKKSAKTNEVAVVAKPKVTTEVVHIQDVEMISTFTGNVEGYAVNNISPAQNRRITKLLVDVGDRVKAGQKVAELDNSALVQAKVQYENNKAAFERADQLYKFGGLAKANWDAAKTAYEVSKSSYENLKENTVLCSPISGVVTARNYDNGDMTGNNPIFVVQKINPAKVMINVSESLYSHIKKGMAVNIEFDALEGQTFTGKVARITPSIDQTTRTFEVELVVDNDKEIIKPGMYARSTIKYGKRQNVVVPDLAVVKQLGSGDRFVYIYNTDGTVKYQKVELGRRFDKQYEILSGVNEGDQVVVTGQNALKNGVSVERVNKK